MNRPGALLGLLAIAALAAFIGYLTLRPAPPGYEPDGERSRAAATPEPDPAALPPPATGTDRTERPAGPRTGLAVLTGVVLAPDGAPARGTAVGTGEAAVLVDPADGSFRLALAPGPPSRLRIRHPDAQPVERGIPELRPGDVLDLGRIRLAPGLSIRGVVADLTEAPVPGARVLARKPDRPDEALPVSVTDEQGRFEFGGLGPDDRLELRVADLQFEMAEEPPVVRADGPEVLLVVKRLRVATGRVLVAGEEIGVAGATVRLLIRTEAYREAITRVAMSDGRFAFDLSDARYDGEGTELELQVTAEGFEDGGRAGLGLAELAPGAGFTLELVRGIPVEPGTLRGRVTYDTGVPFTGTITLSFGRQGGAGQIFRTKTDEDGRFTLAGVRPGEYSLQTALHQRSLLSATGRVLVIPPGGEAETEFTVPRGGDVDLTVTADRGDPPSAIEIALLSETGEVLDAQPLAGAAGRILDLSPGTVRLRISAAGFEPETVTVSVVREGSTPLEVRLRRGR